MNAQSLLLLVIVAAAAALAGWQVARYRSRRQTTDLARALELARQEARTDALTGLWNRKAFDEQLLIQCAIARRYELPFTLVLIDIDHFKQINDTHGHSAGDAVLQELAAQLKSSIRDADLVCRFGGEEFALLLPQTPSEGGLQVAERIRLHLTATAFSIAGKSIGLSISAGVASLLSQESAPSLLQRADAALYRSKQAGRNRVSVTASTQARADISGESTD